MKHAEARSSETEETRRWLQRMKNLSLFAVYVAMAFQGVAVVMDSGYAGGLILAQLLFQFSIANWAAWDAQSRGRPLLRIQQEAMFFFAPLAIFVYLVATRRWRGVGLWTLHVLGYMTVFILSQVLFVALINGILAELP